MYNNNTNCQNDIINYKTYINQRCVDGSKYQRDLENFESIYDHEGYFYSLDGLFHYLVNTNKLTKEYCSHFEHYLKDAYSMGLLNINLYDQYYASLDFYLAKSDYSSDKISENPLTHFEVNNFIKANDDTEKIMKQHILKIIKNKGAAVVLNSRGKIAIRFSLDSDFNEYSLSQASTVLSSFMGINIEFTKEDYPDELLENGEWKHYICVYDLLFIHGNVFNSSQNKEFITIDGLYYRNTFKPSKLLQLNQQPKKVPIHIFNLILHLVNYDIERYFIFMNWLAYFFQFLKKSQVAILFKGRQGSGKGTLFKIIEELFGQAYCKQINGDSLKSNYLGSFIENTLFLNFDEISYKTVGKSSFSSFLKAIITNDEVTSEKKGINMSTATKVHAQTILFSNVDTPVEIEESDRRFIVFTTAGNLKETNFFGLGDFESFENKIHSEIEDFAMYLKLFKTDIKLANTVFETPEKALMVNITQNNLQSLTNAILTHDWQYLESLRSINVILYNIFVKQLVKYRVFQKHLIMVYNALYPQDKHISSGKVIIRHLEQIAPHIFGEHNLYKSNGDKYYKLIIEDIADEPVYYQNNNILPPYAGQTLY